mgnify:CR=1 FL=1
MGTDQALSLLEQGIGIKGLVANVRQPACKGASHTFLLGMLPIGTDAEGVCDTLEYGLAVRPLRNRRTVGVGLHGHPHRQATPHQGRNAQGHHPTDLPDRSAIDPEGQQDIGSRGLAS